MAVSHVTRSRFAEALDKQAVLDIPEEIRLLFKMADIRVSYIEHQMTYRLWLPRSGAHIELSRWTVGDARSWRGAVTWLLEAA